MNNEPKIETLRDVPPNKLDETEQHFLTDGATVTSTRQNDGNYSVTGHFNARPSVLISASHQDNSWSYRLKTKLEQQGQIAWWDDSEIEPSSNWAGKIEAVIAYASVAVVFLSPEYIHSATTLSVLMRLARQAKSGRLKLFPIVLYECSWQELQELREYQIWSMAKPIGNLSEHEAERELEKIAQSITDIVLKSNPSIIQPAVKPPNMPSHSDGSADDETVEPAILQLKNRYSLETSVLQLIQKAVDFPNTSGFASSFAQITPASLFLVAIIEGASSPQLHQDCFYVANFCMRRGQVRIEDLRKLLIDELMRPPRDNTRARQFSEVMEDTFQFAQDLTIATTGEKTISMRHLIGSICLLIPGWGSQVSQLLKNAHLDIDDIGAKFLNYIAQIYRDDNYQAWRSEFGKVFQNLAESKTDVAWEQIEKRYTDRYGGREWSVTLEQVFGLLKLRLQPYWQLGQRPLLTPRIVFLTVFYQGVAHISEPDHLAGSFVRELVVDLKALEAIIDAELQFKTAPVKNPTESIAVAQVDDFETGDLRWVLNLAKQLAELTSSDKVTASRHLVAALLLNPQLESNQENSLELEKLGLQTDGLLKALMEALKRHIKESARALRADLDGAWDDTIKQIGENLGEIKSRASSSKANNLDDTVDLTNVGGGLNFSRHATREEVCLRADEYAEALKNFLVASQNHGELCLALFGHWGRGKSFLMQLTEDLLEQKRLPSPVRKDCKSTLSFKLDQLRYIAKKLFQTCRDFFLGNPGYVTIKFSAWKYPNVPEVWVHLYETFSQAAYPANPLRSIPRIVRTGIAKHGGMRIVTALGILAVALYPKPDIGVLGPDLQEKMEVIIGAGGMAWLLVLLSGVWKTTERLSKDFLTATYHRDKLGLQATIGDDLEALLQGWMPEPRPKLCGWLFWILVIMVCLIAGSAWWRIERFAPWAYAVIILLGVTLSALILYASPGPRRALLIVDDLDRCKPDQLLTVVESIKVLLEEPEICSRIQVAMLLEEDVLEQAILEKYRRMGTPEKLTKSGKGGLGWSDQRICRENAEKLFTAHLRLPPLTRDELDEIMRKVVTKERPTMAAKGDSPPQMPSPDSATVAPRTPAADASPETVPQPRSAAGLTPVVPIVNPPSRSRRTQTTIIKELVFTDTDEKALRVALPHLQKACESFNLGPRSVRAFAFRFQLARLLLRQLNFEPDPMELAMGLAKNASIGKKPRSPNSNKSLLELVIDQVA